MGTSAVEPGMVPVDVAVGDTEILLRLEDGTVYRTPVSRFPRLQAATPSERRVWRLIGKGDGIHWPEIDEDISLRALTCAQPDVA